MQLHTWKVSSDLSVRHAFLKKLWKSSLQTSGIHSMSLSGELVQIPQLVIWNKYCFMQGHCTAVQQMAEFLLYLWKELRLSLPVVKGYRAALNRVFTVAGMHLIASRVISRLFSSFEKTCLPREIKPPDWNLFLVLKSLTCLPYEPLKLSSHRPLIWKTCFLLALALVKRVSELYDLFLSQTHERLEVLHLHFCTSFVIKPRTHQYLI